MSKAALVKRAIRSGDDLIGDWNWRPQEDVARQLQLTKVPDYVTDNYGRFMQEQAGKAKAGDMGARDLLKAYGITRSSVNRGARLVGDDIGKGNVMRPEGYMADWLMSPAGQEYLRAAQSGKVDKAAVSDLVNRFQPFGMADTLGKDVTWAAQNSGKMAPGMGPALTGDKGEWRGFAKSMPGIGPAKSGFIASLLGRGDLPTLDARQLVLNTGEPAGKAGKYMRRMGGQGGDQAVDRLAQRQEAMNLTLPKDLQDHYQHLTHHAVWDKVGNDQTTHNDLIRAMLRGKATPAMMGTTAAAAGGAAALQKQYANQP
jgi:hypothetical protein